MTVKKLAVYAVFKEGPPVKRGELLFGKDGMFIRGTPSDETVISNLSKEVDGLKYNRVFQRYRGGSRLWVEEVK